MTKVAFDLWKILELSVVTFGVCGDPRRNLLLEIYGKYRQNHEVKSKEAADADAEEIDLELYMFIKFY